MAKNRGKKGVNIIFLVGEVIDMGVSPSGQRMTVRARLKVRCESKRSAFVYIDVYGKRSCSETMSLVCQTGNIVYVEGEFRNRSLDRLNVAPYVLVTRIDLLFRRRDVIAPDAKIISILDRLDPIGYAPSVNPRGKRKKTKTKEED